MDAQHLSNGNEGHLDRIVLVRLAIAVRSGVYALTRSESRASCDDLVMVVCYLAVFIVMMTLPIVP